MTETAESKSVINQFVQQASQLYSLPVVAMRVIELTSHPKVDARALKECIENDPALTTKVLKAVNSSLFGLSREVSDLNQALALLGTKPLKLLVLGFSLPKGLFEGVEKRVLEIYWRHTLIKAVAAREISERIFHTPGDDVFIAGLLQDIGMLTLVQDLGEPYVEFLNRSYHQEGDIIALEVAALGFDHAVLSARLLEHWGLPVSLVEAVAIPHDAESIQQLPEQERVMPQILHLAELVAQILARGHAAALSELLEVGAEYHGLTIEQLPPLIEAMEEKVHNLAEVLALQLPDDASYTEILREAHGRLSQVAEETAHHLLAQDSFLEESQELTEAVKKFVHRRKENPGSPAPKPTTAAAPIPAVLESVQKIDISTDPGLLGRIAAAVSGCRQTRRPVSLLLFEIDEFDQLIFAGGGEAARQVVQSLHARGDSIAEKPNCCLLLSDSLFGVILEDYDRPQAVLAARALLKETQHWSAERAESEEISVTISAGVASLGLPSKNFPAKELVDAAKRCLSGAQSSGGNCFKSIDIY